MKSHKMEKNEMVRSPGFRGRYEHTIDPKGRLALPARYRKIFGNFYQSQEVYLTTYNNENIVIYPLDVWVELEQAWSPFSPYDEDVEDTVFFTLYNGLESSIDTSGRLLIPKLFRDETGLNGEITIIGKINYFEVWARELAQQHFRSILKKKDPRLRLAEIGAKLNRNDNPIEKGKRMEEAD